MWKDLALLRGGMQTILTWQKKGGLIWPQNCGCSCFLSMSVRIEVLNCICFLINTFILLAWGGGLLALGSGPGMKREETGKLANISAAALPNFPALEQALAKESNFKMFWLAPQLVESKNEKYSLKCCQFFCECV